MKHNDKRSKRGKKNQEPNPAHQAAVTGAVFWSIISTTAAIVYLIALIGHHLEYKFVDVPADGWFGDFLIGIVVVAATAVAVFLSACILTGLWVWASEIAAEVWE